MNAEELLDACPVTFPAGNDGPKRAHASEGATDAALFSEAQIAFLASRNVVWMTDQHRDDGSFGIVIAATNAQAVSALPRRSARAGRSSA